METFLSEFASERQSTSGHTAKSGNVKRKTPPAASDDKSGDEGDEGDDVFVLPQSDRIVLTCSCATAPESDPARKRDERERESITCK